MKNRRGIRHPPSEKAPVSFCDVVDSFSEEEWKLLQLWQKELYNNLMQELQQAFNSLGPLIATSVFSLKPKVKEASCSVKHHHLDTMDDVDLDTMDNVNLYSGNTALESDMMFRENQHLKGSPDAVEHGSLDVPNTETEDMAVAVSFSIKSEEEMYSDFENSESICCNTRYSEKLVADPLFTGKGNLNRKRNISNPFSCNDKPRLCKTPSKKLKTNEVRIANQKNFVGAAWPGNDGELQDDIKTESQSGFHQQGECSLQKTVSHVQPTEICDDSESTVSTGKTIPCEKSTPQRPESDQSYKKDSSTGHHQAPQSKAQYSKARHACTECGRSFLCMSALIIHQRIHTGERPFLCTICGKRFINNWVLQRHQPVHTGARPYQCNLCQKTFTQKGSLNAHERVHIIAKKL